MENLLKRADLAISESRRIRSEVQADLAEARNGLASARAVLQCARAENDRVTAAVFAAGSALRIG